MDAKSFMEALKELEAQKGISRTDILLALKEALRKAYVKSLKGGDDALVEVVIDEEKGTINIYHYKTIVEEVLDDYIEISLEDAKEMVKKDKAHFQIDKENNRLVEEVSVEELARYIALTVKSVLRQKLSEAEKNVIYEAYKDKVGEMISGLVEKCDDKGAMVTVNRSSLYIPRKELIGDEMFMNGDPIRMYVASVSSGGERGSQIRLTRSDAGFLKKLFEESVRDIYDGTVIIKDIAREAGVRSKISVYSLDPNVDPCSSCIGIGGNTIANIISSLGNNLKDKEKVDVIKYSTNQALYIIDALKPANVMAIYVDVEMKEAKILVADGTLSQAIGRRGANARLASKLVGFTLDVHEEKDRETIEEEFGIHFVSVEKLREEEEAREKQQAYDRYIASLKANRAKEALESEMTQGIEKGKPSVITDEELKEEAKEEVKVEVKEEIKEEKKEEVKVPETPINNEPKEVKTTTTLESLEKSLESEKKKETFKATQKVSKRPKTITEKDQAHEELKEEEEKKVLTPKMDIYTKEELEELENEEYYEDSDTLDDEDIDYDEFDSYYDDEN